ncbi:MAG: hypothetical protein KF886_26080 [Candidatus Hydrogenedentes bacterium]|nr:hypothetical protein [Candidatus Hydrogenedentota bacterium]
MPVYPLSFADRHVPAVPLGCVDAARARLAEAREETYLAQIDAEYRAVLGALLEAHMPFRILNLGSAESALADALRAEGYPEFRLALPEPGSAYAYPRDLMVYLKGFGIALVPEGWAAEDALAGLAVECWPTPWAEGGRALVSGDTMVVFRHPEKPAAPDQATLDRLRERGVRVVELPAGIFCTLDRDGDITRVFHEHHIDRAAGLARGPDSATHLLLAPGFRTGPLLSPLSKSASRDAVRRACDAADLALHVLPDTAPPYAASLVQSDAGVIVLGAHDPDTVQAATEVAGAGQVVTTAVELSHFPTFAGAGIHCLVTESPEFLAVAGGIPETESP